MASVVGSDEALAEAAAAGSRAALSALLERHYDRIYRFAWRIAGAKVEAEDVTQDVCVKIATAIRGFRGEARFTTWMYRIAFTAATDRARAGRRVVVMAPSDMDLLIDASPSSAVPSPEDAVIGAELWDAVRALPEQQKAAVLLVYGEDLSHQEVAALIGCTEKTVSWHLHEARKRLKFELEAAG
ncbi:MAG: sigma-70 family RNA polymerase sigma factor [Hyphomicrobiaceae bacterium]|nr:sigma-70 family RNA polymerase sigma factor [Hyphomicrobiaceae bacterium]